MKAILAEYGSWWSSIDANIVNSGNCKTISELQCGENSVFWIETRFPNGRRVLCQVTKDDDRIIEWSPQTFNIRNTVHEYGGGSFIVVDEVPYYITPDGVFRQKAANMEPDLIIAGDRSHRFADLFYHKGILYAVYEVHSGKEVENMIVRIVNGAIHPLVTGADFYAFPRISPDGQYLTWMEWNMPNMPWDETAVVVSSFRENGALNEIYRISREGVNYQCPEWSSAGNLYVISDHTNWWNIYEVNLAEHKLGQNLYPVDAEIGAPLWQFAERHFASNKNGILMDVAGKLVYKQWNKEAKAIDSPCYTNFKYLAVDESGTAYAIAAGPTKSSSVIRIQLDSEQVRVLQNIAALADLTADNVMVYLVVDILRESRSSADIDKYDISIPESMDFQSDGITVQAWFYPPFSKTHAALEDTLPPVVLVAHGGPTAYSPNTLDMRIQYLTTRGFAVCDVNYRGSTGFGTVFRNMLRRSWGIVDRNDMINAAIHLISQKRVDPKRLCIMGSSAGGYLLLATILKSDLFSAAASLYGVSDLVGLAKDTHKFELGYNEQLIGKLPEEKALYEQRSPLNHVDQLSTPVAFFHGEDDPVVPLAQSMQLYEALKKKGIPTSLTVFPDSASTCRFLFLGSEVFQPLFQVRLMVSKDPLRMRGNLFREESLHGCGLFKELNIFWNNDMFCSAFSVELLDEMSKILLNEHLTLLGNNLTVAMNFTVQFTLRLMTDNVLYRTEIDLVLSAEGIL
uniref:Acyl-peptide hydrolase n=1 Tax=Setaria digitata TaxID=48799 RepID=A0A915PQH3_9BILA